MVISIKNLRENCIMLLLIQVVLGGTVRIERKAQYVTWIAIKKDLIQNLMDILKQYPLLTTRKQCQLKFAFSGSNTRVLSAFASYLYKPYSTNRDIKSKSAVSVKYFSTCSTLNDSENTSYSSLHPWFVTGFSDG